jgi:hypothetical protein
MAPTSLTGAADFRAAGGEEGGSLKGGRRGASVKTLKRMLKKAGLKTSGRKAALTRRAKKAHLKMRGGAAGEPCDLTAGSGKKDGFEQADGSCGTTNPNASGARRRGRKSRGSRRH